MSDRLAELRRQRALVLEHVAWLDREIAAATPIPEITGRTVPPLVAPERQTAVLPSVVAPTAAAAPWSTPAADSILDEYRVPETSLKSDVRKGCFLYFAAALLAVALGVAILYLALSRK